MTNWKTNLGGAVSVTGTTLIGVGVLGNMNAGLHSSLLWYVALVGFILSGLGKGLTALFAADASAVKTLSQRVDVVEQTTADNPASLSAQDARSWADLQAGGNKIQLDKPTADNPPKL